MCVCVCVCVCACVCVCVCACVCVCDIQSLGRDVKEMSLYILRSPLGLAWVPSCKC